MSAVIVFNLKFLPQHDNRVGYVATSPGVSGWHAGYGSTPEQALGALKSDISKLYPPSDYDCRYVFVDAAPVVSITDWKAELLEKLPEWITNSQKRRDKDYKDTDQAWERGFQTALKEVIALLEGKDGLDWLKEGSEG